ncbi:hypothetical protein HN51_008952 [Arachis hypogaea]
MESAARHALGKDSFLLSYNFGLLTRKNWESLRQQIMCQSYAEDDDEFDECYFQKKFIEERCASIVVMVRRMRKNKEKRKKMERRNS